MPEALKYRNTGTLKYRQLELVIGGSAHLVNAAAVAAAFERRGQEGREAIQRRLDPRHAGAKHQDIGVVMLPGEPGAGRVVAQCRTDSGMPVRRNADADAGAADQDAALGLAFPDGARQGSRIVGLVDRFRSVGAEVDDLVSLAGQRVFQ
jgi:hypothetical protein